MIVTHDTHTIKMCTVAPLTNIIYGNEIVNHNPSTLSSNEKLDLLMCSTSNCVLLPSGSIRVSVANIIGVQFDTHGLW